jgi:hypothetical protein
MTGKSALGDLPEDKEPSAILALIVILRNLRSVYYKR